LSKEKRWGVAVPVPRLPSHSGRSTFKAFRLWLFFFFQERNLRVKIQTLPSPYPVLRTVKRTSRREDRTTTSCTNLLVPVISFKNDSLSRR
jgi:hypothetical protein